VTGVQTCALPICFSRDDLLGKHRAQLDYQSPGFAEWLEARP
jgi:hypothetical protein